jgi:hypothetical protein
MKYLSSLFFILFALNSYSSEKYFDSLFSSAGVLKVIDSENLSARKNCALYLGKYSKSYKGIFLENSKSLIIPGMRKNGYWGVYVFSRDELSFVEIENITDEYVQGNFVLEKTKIKLSRAFSKLHVSVGESKKYTEVLNDNKYIESSISVENKNLKYDERYLYEAIDNFVISALPELSASLRELNENKKGYMNSGNFFIKVSRFCNNVYKETKNKMLTSAIEANRYYLLKSTSVGKKAHKQKRKE